MNHVPSPRPPAETVWDAVVVGAGVAGLTTALRLTQRGLRVLVVEAESRCGGPVAGGTLTRPAARRRPEAGTEIDVGAESFAVRGRAIGALVSELGLEVVEPAGGTAWIHTPETDFPLPAAGILGIPANPGADDVRRAIGWRGTVRAARDRTMPAEVVDTRSLDAFVRSRYGDRVTDRLVAPVATGVHSAPLSALDVDAVAPGLLEAYWREESLGKAVASLRAAAPAGSAVRGVVGGMHLLVRALVDAITAAGGTIQTDADVIDVSRDHHERWVLSLAGAGRIRTPRLVVTTPGVAERVLGAGPQRPKGTDIRLVSLLVNAPALDDAPRGTGVLVAPPAGGLPETASTAALGSGEPRAKALTHATAKWPWLAERVRETFGEGRHVVRLSYGRLGTRTPKVTVEEAASDASILLGTDLTKHDVVEGRLKTRWKGTLPPPTPGYREAVSAYAGRVDAISGLVVTGSWLAGTGLANVVAHADEAADRLLAE
ncbi:oxygen-dependent protoporphyrinogen oxidase [Paraoerskovia marina]|uniref:Oxygen-dependent protoporphyrinogen oxidase n=1 Tax=Paraoerskovia marina TaxID=545619 RepID=A0A1H1M2N4_9CELL|nr:FAD-dependent oxidoreductase [Paraoerskovia marina]SDR81074.1 oxygen-dependent protoporphyrinogen oxidase [Paraoerskovia marina]